MKEVGHKITESFSQEEAALLNQGLHGIGTRLKKLNMNGKKWKRPVKGNLDLSKQLFIGAEQNDGRFGKVQIDYDCTTTKKATAKKTKISSKKSPAKEQSRKTGLKCTRGKLVATVEKSWNLLHGKHLSRIIGHRN